MKRLWALVDSLPSRLWPSLLRGDGEHGETLKITAKNASAPEKGSWACVSRALPEKTFAQINPVSTLWIKGDGSGATLNVQVQRSRVFGRACSENLVKLDFTGWRRVDLLLRERDADESAEFDWPYVDNTALNTQAAVALASRCSRSTSSSDVLLARTRAVWVSVSS